MFGEIQKTINETQKMFDDKIREMLKPWNISNTKNIERLKKELTEKGLELKMYDSGNIKRYSVKEHGVEKCYFNIVFKMNFDTYKTSVVYSDIVRL